MLKTLRNQLILSHILPLLIIIPLMGGVIVYATETDYLLPNLSRELRDDSRLLTLMIRQQEQVFDTPQNAEIFLDQLKPYPPKRIMLLSTDGRILASTDPGDAVRINQVLQVPGLEDAQNGKLVEQIIYSQDLNSEIVDVLAPVPGEGQHPGGIIRISYPFATATDQIIQLRFLITGILALGLLSGSILGFLLATNIISPVHQVTQAVYALARGDHREKLEEQGPEELKLLLNSVNYLVERLSSLERARRQLLANLIHELGRPLGALRMAIHAAKQGAKQEPQFLDELLLGMEEKMDLLQQLLDDLAHLQDQVLGTLELDRKWIAVGKWLPAVLLPWKEAAPEKGLKWEESIPPDLPTISADPIRLGQVIGNLVSNAFKYTPEGGMVSISAGAAQGEIWISVSDSGPGIPPEDQGKIFIPFFRGDQVRDFKRGTGLGLPIAHDLVIAHGGRIEVESTPGSGTKFKVWIPIHK